MTTEIMWIAKDPNDIPRVYGTGPTDDSAEQRCRDEAIAYVRRRPDCGPLSKWTFCRDDSGRAEA